MVDAYSNNGLFVSSVHPIALRLGVKNYSIVSGLGTAAQGTPDMTVNVSSGVIRNGRITKTSAGNATLAITAAHATLDRYDTISVNTSGTVVYTVGTASASAVPPEIPTNNVPIAIIYVAAASTTVTNSVIYDLRINGPDYIGGSGADGALNVTSGTTNISGVKNYTSVSVSAGATLNITGNTVIRSQGDVSISGSITSSGNTSDGSFGERGSAGVADTSVGVGGPGHGSGFRYHPCLVVIGGGKGGDGASHRGGGGGGGYQRGSDGASGSAGGGISNGSGGNGKFGLSMEVRGNLTFASGSVLNLNGVDGGAGTGTGGGGGGGAAGSFIALVYGDFTNAGSMTCNKGSGGSAATGGTGGDASGGLLKVWALGTISNSGTYTATNGIAETEALPVIC